MNILIVSNMFPNKKNPSYGIFVSRFCNQLEQLGIYYDKVVIYKSNNKIVKMVKYFKFYLSVFFRCLLGKYDMVYIHYVSHSSPPVILANQIKTQKIIINVHGSDIVPENRKQEQMQKYTRTALKHCHGVVVPSEYFRNYVCEKYNYNKKKVYVFPSGGIDNSLFYPFDNERRSLCIQKMKLTTNKLRVGYVGRISKGKGWDTFVLAADRIIRQHDIFEFIMVGSGPDEAALDEAIKNRKLENYIRRFPLMSQEELVEVYNCLNIFIFPTEREGESLGLVAIEAMACGVPTIASDFAAPKYYVEDGLNGFKFEKKNDLSLSEKIILFSQLSLEEVDVLKRGAIDTAKAYYAQNIVSDLERIFKVICSEQ